MREIVVMFCGPVYRKGTKQVLDRKRIRAAIVEALVRDCPLIVSGDNNGNHDVNAFVRLARRKGVATVIPCYDGINTRGDAVHAAAVVRDEHPSVMRLVLVTHWYHLPRALVALRQETEKRFSPPPVIAGVAVLADFFDGLRRLPGEIRGRRDYLRGHAYRRFGRPLGKPDEEREQKTRPGIFGTLQRIRSRYAR